MTRCRATTSSCGASGVGSSDAAALGLAPLALSPCGVWNPDEEYWGDEEQPQDPWVRNVIARGPGPEFEMEQVLPGILAGRAWHENAERW